MTDDATIDWLMAGDPAIAHQTARDLLGEQRPDLQALIPGHGWGRAYLDARNPDGGWGTDYYRPKWACTHYVLQELAAMGFPPDHPDMVGLTTRIATTQVARDGGLGLHSGARKSDTCITGTFLTVASHFRLPAAALHPFVEFLLSVQIADGGFNCQVNRSGCSHGSLHSTLSVLEGLERYESNGYRFRLDDIRAAASRARGFVLRHRFFRSDRTGQVIDPEYLSLSWPPRWKYNILRGLDHFRAAGQPPAPEMREALAEIANRRRSDGRWPRAPMIPGKVFFQMERPRAPGRWATLLALRVQKAYPAADESGWFSANPV